MIEPRLRLIQTHSRVAVIEVQRTRPGSGRRRYGYRTPNQPDTRLYMTCNRICIQYYNNIVIIIISQFYHIIRPA